MQGTVQIYKIASSWLREKRDDVSISDRPDSEDKLTNRGQRLLDKDGKPIGVKEVKTKVLCAVNSSAWQVNRAATSIAKEVAAEGGALTLGSLSQTPSYLAGKGKAAVQAEFAKQVA